jgi:uncharacterized protein YjiS (DUF1127 family)
MVPGPPVDTTECRRRARSGERRRLAMREAASFIASQSRSAPAAVLPALVDAVQGAWRAWSNRRKLTSLTDFDDHLLADIGLTRDDVRVALDLPFAHDPSLELQRIALKNRRAGWRG